MSRAHLTAMARTKPSAPARWLDARGLLQGRCLDYGCGRGADAEVYGMDGYDPFWRPEEPEGPYDTITCTFVLNVIPCPEERSRVLERIRSLLAPGGTAYVAVRNDRRNLNGWTSRGTWQGLVEVPGGDLLAAKNTFRIFSLTA